MSRERCAVWEAELLSLTLAHLLLAVPCHLAVLGSQDCSLLPELVHHKIEPVSYTHLDVYKRQEINSIQLPLFDLRLRNIGELKFNYQVIFPFSGTLLETCLLYTSRCV